MSADWHEMQGRAERCPVGRRHHHGTRMRTGTVLLDGAEGLCPNWAEVFRPQQKTWPSHFNAQAWNAPLVTVVQSYSVPTRVGSVRRTRSPTPNSPFVL